jgi:hypothetical protein
VTQQVVGGGVPELVVDLLELIQSMNMTANPADLRPCWLRDVSKRAKVAARLRQPVSSSAEARIGDITRQGLDSLLAKMRNAQEIVTIGKQLGLLPRQLTDVLNTSGSPKLASPLPTLWSKDAAHYSGTI